jgi:hypothetical protein
MKTKPEVRIPVSRSSAQLRPASRVVRVGNWQVTRNMAAKLRYKSVVEIPPSCPPKPWRRRMEESQIPAGRAVVTKETPCTGGSPSPLLRGEGSFLSPLPTRNLQNEFLSRVTERIPRSQIPALNPLNRTACGSPSPPLEERAGERRPFTHSAASSAVSLHLRKFPSAANPLIHLSPIRGCGHVP